MVNQYPHTIKVQWTSASTTDEDGNPVAGTLQSYDSSCRAEPNGSGRMIPSVDGALVAYSFTVYMPVSGVLDLPVGAKVSLNIWGRSVESSVKQFSRNFFNARLWL